MSLSVFSSHAVNVSVEAFPQTLAAAKEAIRQVVPSHAEEELTLELVERVEWFNEQKGADDYEDISHRSWQFRNVAGAWAVCAMDESGPDELPELEQVFADFERNLRIEDWKGRDFMLFSATVHKHFYFSIEPQGPEGVIVAQVPPALLTRCADAAAKLGYPRVLASLGHAAARREPVR